LKEDVSKWKEMLLKEDLNAQNVVLWQLLIKGQTIEQNKVIKKNYTVLFARIHIILHNYQSMSKWEKIPFMSCRQSINLPFID
jgi:hypothetical protein